MSDTEAFQEWMGENPRETHALKNMPEKWDLRDRFIAAILRKSVPRLLNLEVLRFAEALDRYEASVKEGTFEDPPRWTVRRPIEVRWVSTTKLDEKPVQFRVDFKTEKGWSGYFITNSPKILGKLKQSPSAKYTLVGNVEKRHTRFFVLFGGKIALH